MLTVPGPTLQTLRELGAGVVRVDARLEHGRAGKAPVRL